MGTVADNSRDGLVAQLHEVWQDLARLGADLGDAAWTTATPCPGWDVAAQYAHIIGTESMLLGRPNPEVEEKGDQPAHVRNQIGGFNEVWVEHLAGRPRADVLARFDEIVEARTKALAGMTEADFEAPSWTPVGQADYRRFMQIRVFDCWVHDQDIRDAAGRPGLESGPVVDQSIDEIVRALGFVVGKKAGAPQGSSVRFELTGPVSRRIDVDVIERAQVVDTLAGPPAVTLTMPSSVFTRLACGRVAPPSVEVAIDGDAELGRRVVDNLAFTI